MTLAPFLDPRDIVIDLEATLPREEVASHKQVVKGRDSYESEKLGQCLRNDRVLEIVGLHRLESVVQEAQ